jgi:hypothetical protein
MILKPLILFGLDSWDRFHNVSYTIACFVSFDILIVQMIVRGLLSMISPLSILSYISILKANNWQSPDLTAIQVNDPTNPTSKLLSFELRNQWIEMDPNLPCYQQGLVVLRRLFSRFTIAYSFLKLLICTALSMIISYDFFYCSSERYGQYNPSIPHSSRGYKAMVQCQSHHCRSYCPGSTNPYTELRIISDSETSSNICTVQVTGQCICDSWLTFQFTVLLLHIAHFLVQSYFYLRYDYFDPQQNQIDCVQSYTFAGKNLALFLSHPTICLLSTMEAAGLVLVWIEVIATPGASCLGNIAAFDLLFASVITFSEFYKANACTFLVLFRQQNYLWAIWSLFRFDLFIFYGYTLFLQTFVFPFSSLNYGRRLIIPSTKQDSESAVTVATMTINDDTNGTDDVDSLESAQNRKHTIGLVEFKNPILDMINNNNNNDNQ